MSSEQSFVEAILHSPDDDALRLIFADWLEERGDPRGEFIRVQYALMDEKLDKRTWFELKTREEQLIAEHGRKWAGPVKDVARFYDFHRGMVEEVSLDAKLFLRHATLLFTSSPIRSATIQPDEAVPPWEVGPDLTDVFDCPHLSRLENLDLSLNELSDATVHLLAECSHLNSLKGLRLELNQIGLDGARALANSTAFPALRRLSLSYNPIEDMGFQTICASSALGQLTSLHVEQCDIGIDGLRSASKNFRLMNLEELNLGNNRMDRQTLAALARFPFAKTIQALRLHHSHLNSTAIQPLTDSPTFAGLKTLDLGNNLLTDMAANHLAASPHLAGLKHLHLEGNNIGPAGREKLKTRFGAVVSF